MRSRARSWIAAGVLVAVGGGAVRPAIAQAAEDDEPTVTPYRNSATPVPGPAPAAPAAAPPAAQPPARIGPRPPPPPARTSAAPAAQPTQQPPGYPPPGYVPYPPPPGYAPYPPPGYAPYPYAPYPGYPPPQLVKVHRPRRGLVTAGAITFGVSWSLAASISLAFADCTDCNSNVKWLWVPIAGPLFLAGGSSSSGDATPIMFLWSLSQAAGVAMFAFGMAGRDVMEYRYAQNGPTFQLGPLIARDASGMTLSARW